MYSILTINSIAEKGLENFRKDNIPYYADAKDYDAIILRSKDIHEMEQPESLLAVARAGAGYNNIPVDKMSEKGIVVFNTPGANANAVKELTIGGLILASRKIAEGIIWAKDLKGDVASQVEDGKKAFVGPELIGKTLGVIGLGAIGAMVANTAIELGMDVLGYDPFIDIDAAWHLSAAIGHETDLKTLVAKSDYISIHVPVNDSTTGMINADFLAGAKDGVRIVNFARGELVNEDDLIAALECGKVAAYVSDFPSEKLLAAKNTTMVPHLGASTPESEENCAIMAAKQLVAYLKYGNIVNSVNFPNTVMPYTGKTRIAIVNNNVPSMISKITTTFADEGINIDNMVNRSRGDLAYTLIDVDSFGDNGEDLLKALRAVDGIVRVRLVQKA